MGSTCIPDQRHSFASNQLGGRPFSPPHVIEQLIRTQHFHRALPGTSSSFISSVPCRSLRSLQLGSRSSYRYYGAKLLASTTSYSLQPRGDKQRLSISVFCKVPVRGSQFHQDPCKLQVPPASPTGINQHPNPKTLCQATEYPIEPRVYIGMHEPRATGHWNNRKRNIFNPHHNKLITQ